MNSKTNLGNVMSDILSAISIVLAIIIAFLDKTSKKVEFFNKNEKPSEDQKVRIAEIQGEFRKTFLFATLPLFIFDTVFCYLLFPGTISIIKKSSFNIWIFDLTTTLYIVIFVCIFITFVLSLLQNISIIKRRYEIFKNNP